MFCVVFVFVFVMHSCLSTPSTLGGLLPVRELKCECKISLSLQVVIIGFENNWRFAVNGTSY